MSKLTRQTLLQFARDVNAAADIGKYGSGATGSPVYSNVITTIQALAAWTTGWAAETVANNRPFLEDMNAVDYVFGYMLCYIFQMGIPEWDAGTNYFINSIVMDSSGVLWQSLIDNNLNVTPVAGVSWKQILPVGGLVGNPVAKTIGTPYLAATDGFVSASCFSDGGGNGYIQIKTDAANPPTTVWVRDPFNNVVDTSGGSVGFLVKKGNYYMAEASNGSHAQLMSFTPTGA